MKNKLILIGILLWLLYFISYPQDAFSASCSGILLWFEQILPALLPYAILSNIILSSQIFSDIGQRRLHLRRRKSEKNPKFNLSLSSAEIFVIICGMAFGFPIGSKLSADMCKRGIIASDRAQLLAAFANNMSPAFVSNYVLTYCLNRTDLQPLTYILIYGIPLIYGIAGLCIISKSDESAENNSHAPLHIEKPASRFHIDMQIVDAGITQSFETLVRLCGYIVIFSIMSHIIMQFEPFGKTASICLTGILEVTNGISVLGTSGLSEYIQYLLAVGFLSFGGLSGIAQTGSMISHAGLSLQKYIKTKLILTAIILSAAVIYTQLAGVIFY